MMKKVLFICLLAASGFTSAIAQTVEYKVITIVESIVPMGLGRSRMIEHKQEMPYEEFTTERVNGKDSRQSEISRGDAKIDNMAETKLLNFYSGVGINFQNIASNDAIISDKMNAMAEEGWELAFVTSGVESKGSKDDDAGIFITRLTFKRVK